MSAIIRVLSEHTINQIAAGEVIENPASIVKELVENAIDAGAKKVIIEVLGGGLQMIRISDDGCGMNRDDAVLCLQRHATSKIKEAADLCHVQTMGFRGEALASIAAISRMTIETALSDGNGTRVEVEAGRITSIQPCARNQGTTLEVRQLFFNVPARKKFQKSPSLCAVDISKITTSLSLANPFVSFELFQQNRMSFSTRNSQACFLDALKERTNEVLGETFLQDALLLDAEIPPFRFTGIVGSVQNTRPNRIGQYQFINQRSVTCPMVSFAVKDAYGTRIAPDRFPIYVLHIAIPHPYVDVNVHPQKKEVRLREEKWIKQQLQEKIQEQLQGMGERLDGAFAPTVSLSFDPLAPRADLRKTEDSVYEQPFQIKLEPATVEQTPISFIYDLPEIIGQFSHFLLLKADPACVFWSLFPQEADRSGLFIVDLQLAMARVLYDAFDNDDLPVKQQGLLLPLSFSCSLHDAEWLMAQKESWEKMGFSMCLSGKNAFLIDAIPSILSESEALEVVHAFLEGAELGTREESKESAEMKKKRRLAATCCRLAKSRKQTPDSVQARALLGDLLKTSSPNVCPVGNKTIIYLGEDEIQKFFTDKKR
jgi:DNA mismatch repair protein MutL